MNKQQDRLAKIRRAVKAMKRMSSTSGRIQITSKNINIPKPPSK